MRGRVLRKGGRAPVGLRLRIPPVHGLDRWWAAACALLLIVSSDYEWRRRSVEESLAGRADLAILLEITAYGAVAAYLLLNVLTAPRTDARPPGLLIAAWGFGITVLLSALYAPSPKMAFVRGLQLIVACALMQAVARHATRAHLHRFAHGYVVLCVASVAVGLAVPMRTVPGRFGFLYVHPVTAGGILGLGAVCAFAYLLASHNRQRRWAPWPPFVYAGVFLIIASGLFITVTRTAIIAAVIGCGLVAMLTSGRARRTDMAAVGLILAVLVGMFAGPALGDYLGRGQDLQHLQTLNSRTMLWSHAWERFSERPLEGHGVTAARGLFLDDIGLGGAHNALVEVAVNNGLIGLSWWLALLSLLVAGLWFAKRRSGRHPPIDVAMLSGLFGFLVVNGVSMEGAGTPANTQITWLLLMGAWVILLNADLKRRLIQTYGGRSPVPFTRQLRTGRL